MLTAKRDTVRRVPGLESGADDYVTKPFSPKELIARIRARVRRQRRHRASEALAIGDLSIDVARPRRHPRAHGPVGLTPLEFDLLVCLARKPWQVFTREVLLEQVWGYRHSGRHRLVNVHVQRLRSKVEHDPENPEIVVTVRGVGYKAGNGSRPTTSTWLAGPQCQPRPLDRGPRVRRALTFWRRSIQARVVASTVLLSVAAGQRASAACLIAADPRRARSTTASTRCSPRPRTRSVDANARSSAPSRPRHRPGRADSSSDETSSSRSSTGAARLTRATP